MVVSSCWVLFSSSPGRTSTASSISFATITMHIYWHDGWLLYASGDVSMVECRVLPIVLLFSLYRANTGDSSYLYSRNCIHPDNWIYLYQRITIVAYTSCKSDMSAPTVNDHPSIVIILRPDVVCIFINYHHNNYIPALSQENFCLLGIVSIDTRGCLLFRMHYCTPRCQMHQHIFYTRLEDSLRWLLCISRCCSCNSLVCTIKYTILNRWQYLVNNNLQYQ